MNVHRRIVLAVALLALAPVALAFRFIEDFPWSGQHAFFTNGGQGTAVWWDANAWEVRNGTQHEEIEANTPILPYTGKFAAIEKARTVRKLDGRVVDTVATVGGDGSAGVGVMHIDFQGITSARLRNPMIIRPGGQATVSFYAPRFNTTGHWWEVAITPIAQTTAADFTAVPGRQPPEDLSDPTNGDKNGGGSTNGPGNRVQVADSINVISTGWPDAPACNNSGWHTRYAVTQASNGAVTDFINPSGTGDALPVADPQENVTRELYPWQIVYTRTGIDLKSDFDEDGQLETIQHWNVNIPWGLVYVNFLYVAYQADHHPQAGCGFGTFGIAQAQEMEWRHIVVSPVKYAHTYVLPDNAPAARSHGMLSYDLRDVGAHFGAPVGGLPQPNVEPYDEYLSYEHCWEPDPNGGLFCGDASRAHRAITPHLTLDAKHLAGLAAARLIADVRLTGRVRVSVNGQNVPALQGEFADRPADGAGFPFEPQVWVERSTNIPVSLLHEGDNVIRLVIEPQPGYWSSGHGFAVQPVMEIDRIQLELDNTQ